MHQPTSDFPNELIDRIHPHARVAVMTGAGVSTASGVPTFRGADGLWKNYSATDLATPAAFARDPATVWEWYGWRRDLVHDAAPNPAHRALAQLATHVAQLNIVTQNVDGLHERCGLSNGEIVRLHGSLWVMRCTVCGAEREDHRAGPAPGELPCCSCEGLLRPGVVWFGEQLAMEDVRRAEQIVLTSEVLLVVGTSSQVFPAAGLIRQATASGAYVAEFNLERTACSNEVDASIFAPCEESLPALVEALGHHGVLAPEDVADGTATNSSDASASPPGGTDAPSGESTDV